MRGTLILRDRIIDEDGDLTELVLWRVPKSPQFPDGIRYRLAFVFSGTDRPAVLYDNEDPKSHHRQFFDIEERYEFSTVDQVLSDFKTDIFHAKGWPKGA